MTVRVSVLVVLLTMLAGAGRAGAQEAYVSAGLIADIVRSTHSEYPGLSDSSAGGEAIGFALRAGTSLGAMWGVEVEFARPGEIEHEIGSGIRPLLQSSVYGVDVPRFLRTDDASVISQLVAPGFSYTVRSRERNTTLSTALWLRQELTDRVSMVYLGGVAFSRAEFGNEVTYAPFILAPPSLAPLILPPTFTDTIVYGVQPLVGVESRIGMTDHVGLVPGLRMQASDGRWLVRPSVALSWTF